MTLRTYILIGLVCVFGTKALAYDIESFNQHLNNLLIEHDLPGVVVHIKHNNELVLHQAFGKVNVKRSHVLQTDNIFRIYSMTKPLTAVALLQLVDKGLIDLKADIRQYLPEFVPFTFNGEPKVITIHQLLSHTAGFGYGGGFKSWVDFRYLLANPMSRSNDLRELVDDISGIGLKFSPGDKFEYSIASDIQGAIIEAVTNQPLDEYFREHLFEPLEMVDTEFYVPEDKQSRLVDMYEYDAGTFEKAYTFDSKHIHFVEEAIDSEALLKPTLISAGGGLMSTSKDYANFVEMLLNGGMFNGQVILSNKMLTKMLSSHTQGLDTHFMPRVYKGVGFGYGLGIKEIAGDTRSQGSFFWSGLGGTLFWGDPQRNLQVVVMFQVEDGWVALEKWMIEHVYQLIDSKSQK